MGQHPTCAEVTGPGDMVRGERTWMCTQDCPRPAGPDDYVIDELINEVRQNSPHLTCVETTTVAKMAAYRAERECGPAADDGWWHCAPYAECTHPGGCLLGDLADPAPADDRGPVVPIAADPERDARREIYRDRERRRAARALDRYIEVMNGPNPDAGATRAVAGERFVEAVGDYVLARLGETDLNARAYGWEVGRGAPMAAAVESSPENPFLHQKAHYDVAPEEARPCTCGALESGGGHSLTCCYWVPRNPDCPPWNPVHRTPDDPCAGGRCPDRARHAEGGHDV